MAQRQSINRESLEYHPSKVSWATADFLDVPPRAASRVFLYCVVAFVGLAIAYAAWSRVAISVEARGQIVTQEGSVSVVSERNLRVLELHVREGDRVEAGDVLVEGEGRLSSEEYLLVETHHRALTELLERQAAEPCPECVVELRNLSRTAFRVESSGRTQELLAETRQLLSSFLLAEEALEGMEEATRGERQRIAVARERLRLIRRRGAEQLLAGQVETLEGEISQARSAIAERRQRFDAEAAQARSRLEVRLDGLLEEIARERALQVLTSPASGRVSNLSVSGAGELIPAGNPVLQILRLESGFMAHLYVANEDIAKVEPGMEVRVKIDALPEREFGTLGGTVETIPDDVIEERAEGAPAYEVPILLDREYLVREGREYPLRLGMTLEGRVVTGHESLLTIGFRKIFRVKDSLFN